MALVRRSIHIVAWIGTVVVLVVSLALIVSQTPWFRDWIRRTIVRETKQYLNGELTIGQVGGNLFYGITLSDVAVDVSGERVIAIKGLAVAQRADGPWRLCCAREQQKRQPSAAGSYFSLKARIRSLNAALSRE